jgi:glycolate oxidase
MEVRMLTIEGEELVLGGEALDAPGFDLLALANGSEGMLGVITEVLVRLLPLPETAQVVLAGFDSVGQAAATVGSIIGAGIIPAGLEMMDRLSVEAVEAFNSPGYPGDAEAVLLCELDGGEAEVAEQMTAVRNILEANRRHRWPCQPTRPSAYGCGRVARTRFLQWAGSDRITTAWMAPSRAVNCPASWQKSVKPLIDMDSPSPMCSTPGTATCTPLSCMTPTVTANWSRPRTLAPKF